jgi:NadR type nicotinamide-nucleotide adenylyltransferase
VITKKIAVLGPESTGKTWLCVKLANHYRTTFCEEYARIYFQNKKYEYSISDIDKIALGQFDIVKKQLKENKPLLFFDTDFITLKIWSEVVFEKTTDTIENLVRNNIFDLYLLCNIDMPWKEDPLRKNKHNRQYIFDLFVKELVRNNLQFKIVSGSQGSRLQNTIKIIDNYLINND